MDVVECLACGGSVVYDAGAEHARCLFCASVALTPSAAAVEQPELAIPFHIDHDGAQRRFVAWATSSWWYPKQLRKTQVELAPLFIPAWRLDATVEGHFAGLASASTRSGRKPESGVDTKRRVTWVPASLGLNGRELAALNPFHEDDASPWKPSATDPTPFETNGTSRAAALQLSRAAFATLVRNDVARRLRLSDCHVLATLANVDTKLMMLPVYIGSFRFRGRPWRFVVNAQTGRITGEAPLDRRKIALAVVVVLVIALLWWLRQSGA